MVGYLYLLKQPLNRLKMAKVKFSALVSEMRNKLNGSVFSRNRGGAYLRTKVTPLNPQSIAQVLVRARFTGFSQAWRSLTDAQRDAWRSAVSNWATTDVFGDLINPTGATLYIRLNTNIQNAGGAVISLPPAPAGADALTALSVVAGAGAGTVAVTFDPAAVPAGHGAVLDATANLSPGVENANSQFRQIDVLAAAEASPYAAGASYVAKFGGLTEGQRIFVRLRFVNLLTGERSQAVKASAIVGA
jgi:hypothetical protein